MRRALAACLVGILGAAGCAAMPGEGPETPETPVEPPKVEAPGAWIPPYSPAQLALLAPVGRAISTRAVRVLPDLGRFAYAANRPLRDPDEALKIARDIGYPVMVKASAGGGGALGSVAVAAMGSLDPLFDA